MQLEQRCVPLWMVALAGAMTALVLISVPSELSARSGGIDGYSGNPATGGEICTACHSGGVAPSVTLSGPTLVEPGTVHTYTLTVSGGQQVAAGLDVSVTDGTLSVTDVGTYLSNGEITHSSPRPVEVDGSASWTFDWNVPVSEGTAVIYGAGNSVNLANGNNGDLASSDQLVVTIAAVSPGETSGAGASPLRVTGFDKTTGELSLSYESGCAATDNNVYYGPLDSVSTYTWSGEVCGIGTSGSLASFDPGAGSYFFVVVGTDGAEEGSYGLSAAGGSESERPAFAGNACGQSQQLDDRCD